MFSKLLHAAEANGFTRVPGHKHRCVERDRGFITNTVCVDRDRHDRGIVHPKLLLNIRDRFYSPRELVVVLVGFLHEDRVAVLGYAQPREWREKDEDTAVEAFIQHGLPWFDTYSSLEVLVERLERELRDGVVPDPVDEASLRWERFLLRRSAPKKRPRPPINHYYLSLLYDEMGDQARACHHCQEYLLFVSDGQHESTVRRREHAQRQLREMGCAPTA